MKIFSYLFFEYMISSHYNIIISDLSDLKNSINISGRILRRDNQIHSRDINDFR